MDTTTPRARGAQQGVEAIETGGRLLDALAASTGPMMLRDLAAAASMAPAKAHRYLVSLIRVGLVAQHPDTGRYDVGGLAVRLGIAGLGRLDALALAQERLPALRDVLSHTVALAVWADHGPTIVRWLDSSAPVSASLRTGATMPLTRSATGRAFAAFHRRALIERLLKRELAANARAGVAPRSLEAMETILAQCRRHGLGRVTGELMRGIDSLAAPVFDNAGDPVLVVTSLGHAGSFDASWTGPIARHLREWAHRTSSMLGYAANIANP